MESVLAVWMEPERDTESVKAQLTDFSGIIESDITLSRDDCVVLVMDVAGGESVIDEFKKKIEEDEGLYMEELIFN